MHKKYVGITIGPIFDTILDASSPAALWFASYLFSDITKRICEKISAQDGFSKVKIYTPYFDKSITLLDGVGKFHDRIIFSTSDYSKEKMDQIITSVKEETIHAFPMQIMEMDEELGKAFLREYLQIHYVVKENLGEKNCILALSPYLDALELMKTFPKDDVNNPIRKLFSGETEKKNVWIKESPLFKQIKQHQMRKKDNTIVTIEEIAACKMTEPLKRKHYFAVVTADGDNMGEVLKNLVTDEAITNFSKDCLEYTKDAAKRIHEFGGVTIYAGGDDLLFLAPVMNGTKNIMEICDEIQSAFRTMFAEKYGVETVSVSFGVSIQYARYPLYEAMASARKLLRLAKKDEKNNLVLGLQKHSGQSIEICVPNEYHNVLGDILDIKMAGTTEEEDQMLHSVSYTLETFASLMNVMDDNARKNPTDFESYKAAWLNLFDNDGQKKAHAYIEAICRCYFEHFVIADGRKISAVDDTSTLRALLYTLKLKKFLVEKEGENE